MRAMSPVYIQPSRNVFFVSVGICQYPCMTDGDLMTISPMPPTGSSSSPASASIILQSTLGNGTPIEPDRGTPFIGLAWVATKVSVMPKPSTNLPPVNRSNSNLVSNSNGAEPEIQARMELISYLPAITSGLLLMAMYMAGTPGKMLGPYLLMLPSKSL